ncbi:MAG: tRNA (N6-isopentenyl adenosine(37)-C2)-methylthiotransferase MiaB [Deltaproteobacteria bacterium]|nr:tRNA (N6-isopentenyl adenosine(37)-C2)-methylthiotransferase MiaB [Deltaproteobacteria bacterium]
MKAYIKTYGCQMNEQDSLQMKGLLSRIGYGSADEPEGADLVLISTCSIREKAVHKVYSDLGRIRPLTEENPAMIVGIAGCVAQQEKGNLLKRFPFVDLVFGPDAIRDLPSMVEKVQKGKKGGFSERILNTQFRPRDEFEFVNLIVPGEENRVRAFVNIQKGCDNICSFCVVPRVRGREVSRPSSDIIREINALVDMGVKEVTLLGQNVNSYGLKNTEITFAQLLQRIGKETDLKRLRFTTSHPKDVGDDLVRQYEELEMLCPHFHLPVQSGSDRILEAMKRRYTRSEYLGKIAALKKARPGIAFSSDFIIGFPGETEEDFEASLSLVDEVGFHLIFSFIYSPRPMTSAALLPDDVPKEEKSRRLALFQEKQKMWSLKRNEELVGRKEEVLIENRADSGQNWFGRTKNNTLVSLKPVSDDDLVGKLVTARVTEASVQLVRGEIV